MERFERFRDCFVRNNDGSWFCRAPAQISGPQGQVTFTPGVTYRRGKRLNGYDVAQWLEDWEAHRRAPLDIAFQ